MYYSIYYTKYYITEYIYSCAWEYSVYMLLRASFCIFLKIFIFFFFSQPIRLELASLRNTIFVFDMHQAVRKQTVGGSCSGILLVFHNVSKSTGAVVWFSSFWYSATSVLLVSVLALRYIRLFYVSLISEGNLSLSPHSLFFSTVWGFWELFTVSGGIEVFHFLWIMVLEQYGFSCDTCAWTHTHKSSNEHENNLLKLNQH